MGMIETSSSLQIFHSKRTENMNNSPSTNIIRDFVTSHVTKSTLTLARSIVSIPSSSKRHVRIGLLSAATITALCTNATNAAAATLNYFTNLSSFNAASSISAIDDFESGTPHEANGVRSFVRNGNTFTANSNDVVIASPGYTNFGTPITTTSILSANSNEDFTITFGTPNSAVGFDTYTNGYGAPTVRIFGSGGLLGTYSVSQDSTKIGFFGVTASEAITSIRWTGVLGNLVNTGIDNLRTGSANATATSVPEPSAVPGLLLGSALVVGVLRKRKQKL